MSDIDEKSAPEVSNKMMPENNKKIKNKGTEASEASEDEEDRLEEVIFRRDTRFDGQLHLKGSVFMLPESRKSELIGMIDCVNCDADCACKTCK